MRKQLLLAVAAMLTPGAARANLVLNGDFSGNYANFLSDYTQIPTNHTYYTTPPDYAVITNAATSFTNGYLSFGDHTTGSGNMLFFDGNGFSYDIWRQAVTLAANTNYVFSFYATTPDGGTPAGSDLASLAVRLNGVALGAGTVITGQGGSGWQLVSRAFTTAAAGSYTLAIYDLNGEPADNDDVIDDIDLEQVGTPSVPEPASWAFMVAGFGVAGRALRRAGRRRVRFA